MIIFPDAEMTLDEALLLRECAESARELSREARERARELRLQRASHLSERDVLTDSLASLRQRASTGTSEVPKVVDTTV